MDVHRPRMQGVSWQITKAAEFTAQKKLFFMPKTIMMMRWSQIQKCCAGQINENPSFELDLMLVTNSGKTDKVCFWTLHLYKLSWLIKKILTTSLPLTLVLLKK